MGPKISVIVPVYKAEAYLHRCVNSILNQTFTDFELLLIDDGSPDSSGEICDEYAAKDSRVRVFHKENGGVSSARNLGLDNAVGRYITFVDSDDWLEEECFEYCVNSIKDDIDLVQLGFTFAYANGSMRKSNKLKDTILPSIDYINNSSFHVCVWGNIFKKTIIDNYIIRFDETMKLGEDQKFLLDYMRHCSKIQSISMSYYNYYQNIGSVMHNTKTEDLFYCAYKMADYKSDYPIFTKQCDGIILLHFQLLLDRPEVKYKDLKSLHALIDSSSLSQKRFIVSKLCFALYYYISCICRFLRN